MRAYASAEMTLTDTNDGVSVTGIDRYYMASSSSSGITVDSQGWQPDPQETNPVSRYHWSYEVVKYSDGAAIPSKPAVIGVYGRDGKEGVDAVTVSLSSEAHTFTGTEDKAIASSITIDIYAFKGAQRIPTSIGTVTGGTVGQINYNELDRGKTSNRLVINVTSSLSKGGGTLSIPIVADGRTFNKVFSWSVAFKGLDGAPTYTWIKYADTPTSGMSNSPVDKKYIGLAFNKTTQTESSDYNDYKWSLMPQNIEVGGRNYWALVKEPWFGHLEHLGDGVFTNRSDSTSFAFMTMNKLGVDVGENYTLSFEVKVKDESIQFINNTMYVNNTISNATHNRPTLIKDKWVKVFSTFNYSEDDTSNVHIYFTEIPSINSIEFRNFKIEKGDIATDWTEAPEDIQAKIGEKASAEDLTDVSNNLNESIGDLSNIVEGKVDKTSYEEFIEYSADIQQQLSDSLVSAEESISGALARTAVVEQNLGEGAADWIFTHTNIRMSDEGITLGEEGSGSYLQISNEQISFFNGSSEPVAFISSGMLNINHAIFVESIQISQFMFSSELHGHLTLRYVGN